MEQIKLNKETPEIVFNLNAEDSYLLIHSVLVTPQRHFKNEWTNFISTINLSAELKYIVFDDSQQGYIDERKNQFPTHLLVEPFQVQPIFQLDKLIKNETFTIGINQERKFYQTLKLEVHNFDKLDDEYTLAFNIEKFKIDDN